MLSLVMSSSRSLMKFFFSSHEGLIENVDRVFKTYRPVAIYCEEAQTDVATYIDSIIKEKIEGRDLAIGSTQLVQKVKDALIQGANSI
jgi:hypothetical protein